MISLSSQEVHCSSLVGKLQELQKHVQALFVHVTTQSQTSFRWAKHELELKQLGLFISPVYVIKQKCLWNMVISQDSSHTMRKLLQLRALGQPLIHYVVEDGFTTSTLLVLPLKPLMNRWWAIQEPLSWLGSPLLLMKLDGIGSSLDVWIILIPTGLQV